MDVVRRRVGRACLGLFALASCAVAGGATAPGASVRDTPLSQLSTREIQFRGWGYCGEIQGRQDSGPRDEHERSIVRTLAGQHVANCMVLDADWLEREGKADAIDYPALLPVYEDAATKNDASAQVALGALYERGLAVAVDREEAAGWYRLAAYQGDARAWAALDRLQRAGVVPDEAAAARDRAAWTEQFARALRAVLEEQIRTRGRPAAPGPVTLRIGYVRDRERPDVAIVRSSGIRGFDAAGVDAVTSVKMPAAPVYDSTDGRWTFEYSIRPGPPG